MKYLFFILIFVLGVQTIQSHDKINEVEKQELLIQDLSSNVSLISTSLNDPEKYDEGYNDGYCEAYKDCRGTPYAECAYPRYIDNQPYINGHTTYKDGWKYGFKHGQEDWCD